MKIFKSIKWRLQLWYGLILVLVLSGFGFTAYELEKNRQFRRLNDELHQRVVVLSAALRRQSPRGPNAVRPLSGQPPRHQNREEPPPEELLDGSFPARNSPGQMPRPPFHFSLPPEAAHLFGGADPNGYYYSIRSRDGREIAGSIDSASLLKMPRRGDAQTADPSPNTPSPPDARPPRVQVFGNLREICEQLPSGEEIRVGCSAAPELRELRRTALSLGAVGGLILLVGLAVGGWLVSRSLRPLSGISAAAVRIAAGDLSQRIPLAGTESELGQLATVLNATFARLESAFAQQRQFAADAAHELRTPVAVILTQTQTSLAREREAASYRQTVEACQRAAQRMRTLIESLLALARFDAGQEVLKRLRFDLAKTVGDCAGLVQPLADERGVKISVEVESLEIAGDPERLAQVVTNLLTNAIHYNRTGGDVRVSLKLENGLAVLAVADTGQGIAAKDLPRVFGRFYRADASRTGAGNTGLGLAITKAIVEAHGGTIEVASAEGAGTTFTVQLPAMA